MRWQDDDTMRIEQLICTRMCCESRDVQHVWDWAWGQAVKRSLASKDGAKEVYLSILGTVLERISRGERLLIS